MIFDTYNLQSLLFTWFAEHGIKILAILFLAYFSQRFLGGFIDRLIRKLIRQQKGSEEAEKKREDTLIAVSSGTLGIVIIVVSLLMVLSEFGIDVAPLIAAAGIIGLALGFGGQYLIRDLISGLFILLENQYRVGDIVCFDETCGLVESLSLRMTTLRDMDGTVHHVPHGEVKKVSNLSKEFARVNIEIGVSYASNLEEVIAVINQTGKSLFEDPAWSKKMISAPQFLRVNDFADSAIILKILGDTKPLAQWSVAGELRKRLKTAFDAHNIDIPFPQRVIHTVQDKKE